MLLMEMQYFLLACKMLILFQESGRAHWYHVKAASLDTLREKLVTLNTLMLSWHVLGERDGAV